MSLKVWLPLDGDLRNLGASDVEVINNGATINDNGKIGKCYSFDGNTNFISLNSSALYSIFTGSTTPMSIAMWVYHNDSTRGILLGDYGLGGINFNVELTTNHKIRFYWAGSPDIQIITIDASTWTHICLTYNGATLKGYKNGVEVYSSNIILSAKSKTSGLYYLGRDYRTGQTALNGKINDVRIYDHCLSAAEVHEISQGLILHYKLDGFNSNLIWNSNWQQGSQNWSGWGIPPTREIVQIDEKNWLHVISNTSRFQGYSQNWNNRNNTDNITQNAQVTVSYTAFSNTSATFRHIGFHWNDENGNIISQSWFSSTLTTTSTRYSFTATTPSNCVKFNIMVGDAEDTAHEIWITDIKLEIGNAATIWTPNENDTLGKIFSIDNNIVQDSSGYGHNGVLVNGTYATKSPRYDTNIKLFGTTVDNTSNILTGAQYFYGHLPLSEISALTVSWWGKNIQYGRGGIFETTASTADNLVTGSGTYDYNTTAIANWDSTFRVYNGNNSINFFSSFSKNDSIWHYNAIVFDGSTAKYYKDGELKQSGTLTGTLPAITGFKMGIGRAGGVYRQIQQEVSDLRIYVTPLLDNDIKMLYNVGMKIDNLQNLHTFNYVENEDSGTKTLTGDIITVEDAASKQLENLVININSTQSGSGDPSPDNVRPIAGWTGAKVTRCGKNLLPTISSTTSLNGVTWTLNADGTITVNGTATSNSVIDLGRNVLTLPAGVYTTNLAKTGYPDVNVFRLVNGSGVMHAAGGGTFTLTQESSVFVRFAVLAGRTMNNVIIKPMLEIGSPATAYEPYAGKTYSITFPAEAGTVCTGTLDATTGMLTVDRAMISDFTGLRSMGKSTSGAYRYQLDLENVPTFREAQCVSNVLAYYTTYGDAAANTFYNGSNRFFIYLDATTTAQAIAWLESNSVVIVYPLATPATYQLDPVSLTLLTGKNNIFADTGDISLKYSYYLPKSQKLTKTGQLIANNFNENKKTSLYKSGFVEANNLIEI